MLEDVQTATADLIGLAREHSRDAAWIAERLGRPLQGVKDELLTEYHAAHQPVRVSGGQDRNLTSIGPAIVDAMLLRAGRPLCDFDRFSGLAEMEGGHLVERKPHDRALQFRGRRLLEIARQWLTSAGAVGLDSLSDQEIASAALNPRHMASLGVPVQLAQSTDSFPYLLADSARKSLRAAYQEAPASWAEWCGRDTAPDYKAKSLVALSEAPSLTERPEGGEYRYAVLSEGREQITLLEYSSGLRFTRRAMLSDDLGGLTRGPLLLAQAARRKEGDVVYAILNANAALADTGALFNTTAATSTGGHANLAGTGAVISLTTLDAGFAAMGLQRGPKLSELNLEPAFILVPRTIMAVAGQYVDPRSALVAADATKVNRYAGRLKLVADARLDRNSTTAWYLAASPSLIDTVVLGFLESEQAPVLKSETDFETDDLKMVVRHSVAAKAVDFRGLYKNAGA
jgi:hypothetical protein